MGFGQYKDGTCADWLENPSWRAGKGSTTSAMYGLVGALALLEAIGVRLVHRGPVLREWSPATGVFLGQCGRKASTPWLEHKGLPLVADAPLSNVQELLFQLMKSARAFIDVVLDGYSSNGLYGGMPKPKVLKLMQLAPLGRGALEEFHHYTQVSKPPRSLRGKITKRLYFGGGKCQR